MLLVLAVAVAALAAEPGAASEDEDVIMAAPDALSSYWSVDRATVERNVGPKDVPRGAIGCAAVSFVVERNGSTSTFKLLRSEPEGWWDELARKVVGGLHFTPGAKNPKNEAVFTYLTLSFTGPGNQILGSHVKARVTLDDRLNELCEVKGMQLGE
jgi:outer membrane biosynthesis protein TonB